MTAHSRRILHLALSPETKFFSSLWSWPNAFDTSGDGYDGNYLGHPALGQPGAIANEPDTAIGLNGPDSMDYLEILDPDGYPFSQPTSFAGLTVEVWMRPETLICKG